MRLLHTADLHLRATDDDRWDALRVILEKAKETQSDAVVICGDMFDKGVDAQRLKPALRGMFESFPFPVVVLPGNHDEKGLAEGDFFGERVTVLAGSTRAVDIGDVRIVGVPFENVGPEGVLDRLLASRAGLREDASAHVLLYHGELLDLIPEPDAFGEEEGYDYMPVRLSAFSGLGFDYVLAGHFHRNTDIRQFDGGYFVYPGSPVSITRRETGIRQVVLVEIGRPPRAVPVDTRHAEAVDIRLDPFTQSDPIGEIRRRVDRLHPRAAAFVTVSGFIDTEALGGSETDFAASIRSIAADGRVAEVASLWRDVGAVVGHELFERFNESLERSSLAPDMRSRVRDMMIDALMETLHAD